MTDITIFPKSHTSLNPICKYWREVQESRNINNKIPIHRIKRFHDVNLQCTACLSFWLIVTSNNLLWKQTIVYNLSIFYEYTLIPTYYVKNSFLKPICKDFSYTLVNSIVASNGPLVTYTLWFLTFTNQCNDSSTQFIKYCTWIKELLCCSNDLCTNNKPGSK